MSDPKPFWQIRSGMPQIGRRSQVASKQLEGYDPIVQLTGLAAQRLN